MSGNKECVALKAARVCKCVELYLFYCAMILLFVSLIEHFGVNKYIVGGIAFVIFLFTVDQFRERPMATRLEYRKDALLLAVALLICMAHNFYSFYSMACGDSACSLPISYSDYMFTGSLLLFMVAVFNFLGTLISYKYLNETKNSNAQPSGEGKA